MFKSKDLNPPSQAKGKPVFSDMFETSKAQASLISAPPTPEQIKLIYQKAYQDGMAKGISDGVEVARAKVEHALDQERRALLELAQSFRESLDQQQELVARDVLALAVKIAKLMVKEVIVERPESVLTVIQDVMNQLPTMQNPVKILLNHHDISAVSHNLAIEIKELGFELIESTHVERGGCLIETLNNYVDATNATRWARVTEALGVVEPWLAS